VRSAKRRKGRVRREECEEIKFREKGVLHAQEQLCPTSYNSAFRNRDYDFYSCCRKIFDVWRKDEK
jgi:hypothetical protein